MAQKFYNDIDLQQLELLNGTIENQIDDAAAGTGVDGHPPAEIVACESSGRHWDLPWHRSPVGVPMPLPTIPSYQWHLDWLYGQPSLLELSSGHRW